MEKFEEDWDPEMEYGRSQRSNEIQKLEKDGDPKVEEKERAQKSKGPKRLCVFGFL